MIGSVKKDVEGKSFRFLVHSTESLDEYMVYLKILFFLSPTLFFFTQLSRPVSFSFPRLGDCCSSAVDNKATVLNILAAVNIMNR